MVLFRVNLRSGQNGAFRLNGLANAGPLTHDEPLSGRDLIQFLSLYAFRNVDLHDAYVYLPTGDF